MVILSRDGNPSVGLTRLVLFDTKITESGLVRFKVRLGMGDTVIVLVISNGRICAEGVDKGNPVVPTSLVRTVGTLGSDASDKLDFAMLETDSAGNVISSDVKIDLTGRPVEIKVILLGVLYSVATPAVTVT